MAHVGVVGSPGGHRLLGDGPVVGAGNRFLDHLAVRGFSPATVRAYAFDLANFAGFLAERSLGLSEVAPADLFDYLDWQQSGRRQWRQGGAAWPAGTDAGDDEPAGVDGAVRWFEFLVIGRRAGRRTRCRRLAGRRGCGAAPRACSVRSPDAVPIGRGGWCASLAGCPRASTPDDVAVFLADLNTHRDRAMVLAMVLGGLRVGRGPLVAAGRCRHGHAPGAGGRQGQPGTARADRRGVLRRVRRLCPRERPAGCRTPECFVVLRGPTRGGPMTEAGLRKVFRVHRARTGATRVRPHRLRHTYATELAAAGIDLLALRELMGHASPETTAKLRASGPGDVGRRVRRRPGGDRAMTATDTPRDHRVDAGSAGARSSSTTTCWAATAEYRRLRLAAARAVPRATIPNLTRGWRAGRGPARGRCGRRRWLAAGHLCIDLGAVCGPTPSSCSSRTSVTACAAGSPALYPTDDATSARGGRPARASRPPDGFIAERSCRSCRVHRPPARLADRSRISTAALAAIDTTSRLTAADAAGPTGPAVRAAQAAVRSRAGRPARPRTAAREAPPPAKPALARSPRPRSAGPCSPISMPAPRCCVPRRSTSSPAPWPCSASSSATTSSRELRIDRRARTPPHRSVPRLDLDPSRAEATTTGPTRRPVRRRPRRRSPCAGSSTTSPHGAGPKRPHDG